MSIVHRVSCEGFKKNDLHNDDGDDLALVAEKGSCEDRSEKGPKTKEEVHCVPEILFMTLNFFR